MSPAPLQVSEGEGLELELTTDQVLALRATTFVTVRPTTSGWLVEGKRGRVGVFRAGGLLMQLTPKIPIARVLFIAGYGNRGHWFDGTAETTTAEGLVPAVANTLWRQTEDTLRNGILHGYVEVDETSTVLRGRLRHSDQLRRHYDEALPMEIRYDDFTVDIPENRILLTAAARMLAVPGLDATSEARLRSIRAKLAGVTPLRVREPTPRWAANRLNAHYHQVLRLCEVLLNASSPEFGTGTLPVNGFVFNLEKVFEDFVTAAFQAALAERLPGRGQAQPRWHLDQAETVRMRPDLVWMHEGRPVTVVDAKYSANRENNNLYQMLAYCAALRADTGHLVYAAGDADPAPIVAGDVRLYRHALDLTGTRADLLKQVNQIADRIAAALNPV